MRQTNCNRCNLSRIHPRSYYYTLTLIWFVLPGVSSGAPPSIQKKQVIDSRAVLLLKEMQNEYLQLTAFEQETVFFSKSEALDSSDPLIGKDSSATAPNKELTASISQSTLMREPEKANSKEIQESESNSVDSPSDVEEKGFHRLPRKVRFRYQAPNRMRLEMVEIGQNDQETIETWDSDGKLLLAYDPATNICVRNAAPKSLHALAKAGIMNGGSLELAMMMGLDALPEMQKQADSLNIVGREQVNFRETNVISLKSHSETREIETKFFIGIETHLLLRMQITTTPRLKAVEVEKPIAFELNPLEEVRGTQASGSPDVREFDPDEEKVQAKITVVYDNKIKSKPVFDALSFAYEPPRIARFQSGIHYQIKRKTIVEQAVELAKKIRKEKNGSHKTLKF